MFSMTQLARHDGFLLKHYAKQSYAETHARPVAQGKDGQAVVGVGIVVEGKLGNVDSWHGNKGLLLIYPGTATDLIGIVLVGVVVLVQAVKKRTSSQRLCVDA